jgi:hypothetical protein
MDKRRLLRVSASVSKHSARVLGSRSPAAERCFAWDQDGVKLVDTRTRLFIVVEIEVRVARSDAARVKPKYAAVAEEHILAAPAMVRAVTLTNREKVLMIGLISKYGHP